MTEGDANKMTSPSELRKRAEDIAAEKASGQRDNLDAILPAKEQQMLHELKVHQIELEMQ